MGAGGGRRGEAVPPPGTVPAVGEALPAGVGGRLERGGTGDQICGRPPDGGLGRKLRLGFGSRGDPQDGERTDRGQRRVLVAGRRCGVLPVPVASGAFSASDEQRIDRPWRFAVLESLQLEKLPVKEASQYYAQSAALFRFLIERYGEEKIRGKCLPFSASIPTIDRDSADKIPELNRRTRAAFKKVLGKIDGAAGAGVDLRVQGGHVPGRRGCAVSTKLAIISGLTAP